LSLLEKARLDARALVVASLSGALLGVVGTAGYQAGRADTRAADVQATAAPAAASPSAATQHRELDVALISAGAPTAATPALLRALAPSSPFRLAAAGAADLDCLTAAVYYEARGESADGQAAVAQVVLNRVRHPSFPKSVCGVVYQGAAYHDCQFSFACDGAETRELERGAWDRARGVAARALSGYVMNEVGRATYFHVAGLGVSWGDEMVRIAQVGQHVFYGYGGHRGMLDAGRAEVSQASDVPAAPAAAEVATAEGAATPAVAVVKTDASVPTPAPQPQVASPS
jgi:spore germination cell wall hydrolase CwlJ-like protein